MAAVKVMPTPPCLQTDDQHAGGVVSLKFVNNALPLRGVHGADVRQHAAVQVCLYLFLQQADRGDVLAENHSLLPSAEDFFQKVLESYTLAATFNVVPGANQSPLINTRWPALGFEVRGVVADLPQGVSHSQNPTAPRKRGGGTTLVMLGFNACKLCLLHGPVECPLTFRQFTFDCPLNFVWQVRRYIRVAFQAAEDEWSNKAL